MATHDLTASAGISAITTTDVRLSAVGPIAEALFWSDLPEAIKGLVDALAETMNVGSPAASELVGQLSAAAGVTLADASQSVTAMVVVLGEGLSFSELVAPNAILNAFLRDGLSIVAVLNVGGEEYVVWVANADTFAHSQYAHFNFNSMCRLGNRYYGANEEGIYLLEGDDDAGDDIRYFATLPKTEFGHSGLKRLPRAYMGFSNAGDMHLKIITPGEADIVYRFTPTSGGQTESLAKIGRGIVARYFTFDLYNYEGGDVELERIEFFPLYMRRLF